MINIQDKFFMDLTLGVETREQIQDFLEPNDLILFKLELDSGAVPPYFHIVIRSRSINVSNKFNRGNAATLRFGESLDRMFSYDIVMGEVNITDSNEQLGEQVVDFEAFIKRESIKFFMNTDYLNEKKNSLDMLKYLCQKNFGTQLISDITHVHDQPMVWRQCGQFNSHFMTDIWLHMNVEPDTPLLYIDTNLNVHLKSLNKIKSSEAKVIFTRETTQVGDRKHIQYVDVFKPQSYKALFGSMAQNHIINITKADRGTEIVEFPEVTKPELASSAIIEPNPDSGNIIRQNILESTNVYNDYNQTYYRNKAALNNLSSICGPLKLLGIYTDINLLDLVEVGGSGTATDGLYIVSDIHIVAGAGQLPYTIIYLTRDNNNHLERDVLTPKSQDLFAGFKGEIQRLYSLVRDLRKYVVMARQVIDGSMYRNLQNFIYNFKNDVLRSFTIAGISLDFTAKMQLINSIKSMGNGIVNDIVSRYLPAPFNTSLQNFIFQDPSRKKQVDRLLVQYAPEDGRLLIREIEGLVTDISLGLNRVSKNAQEVYKKAQVSTADYTTNNVAFTDSVNGVINVELRGNQMSVENIEKRVDRIIQDILYNTAGLDLPIPNIYLTESEKLYNDPELKKLIVNRIMRELEEKGYITGINNFDKVLLGEQPVTYEIINTINANRGTVISSRYWGAFNDPIELTEFFIRDQFRDTYMTPECTRLVRAVRGQRIYLAYPIYERDLKFIINGEMLNMDVIPDMNLGVKDNNGNTILYNIYLSPKGYNGNSNIVEVRK